MLFGELSANVQAGDSKLQTCDIRVRLTTPAMFDDGMPDGLCRAMFVLIESALTSVHKLYALEMIVHADKKLGGAILMLCFTSRGGE